MARRTKDEAEQTRNAILDAAEKVFYAHGVARTSLEQIAAAAHVTRGAVYWHFSDKIEVFDAMMQRVFLPQEDVLEQLAAGSTASASPLTELHAACRDSLRLIARDKRRQRVIAILLNRCEYVAETAALMQRRRQCKDRMLIRCTSLFTRARQLKLLAPGWTPALAATALQALMNGLIAASTEGRKDFRLDTLGVACLSQFFTALKA